MSSPDSCDDEVPNKVGLGGIYRSLTDYKQRQDQFERETKLANAAIKERLGSLETKLKALSDQPSCAVDKEVLTEFKNRLDRHQKRLDLSTQCINKYEKQMQRLREDTEAAVAHGKCDCEQRTTALLDEKLKQSLAIHYRNTAGPVEASQAENAARLSSIGEDLDNVKTRLSVAEGAENHADTFGSIKTQLSGTKSALQYLQARIKVVEDAEPYQENFASINTKFNGISSELDTFRRRLTAADEAHEHSDIFAAIHSKIDAYQSRFAGFESDVVSVNNDKKSNANRIDAIHEDVRKLRERLEAALEVEVGRKELDTVNDNLKRCSDQLDTLTQASVEAASTSRLEDAIFKLSDRQSGVVVLQAAINDLRNK